MSGVEAAGFVLAVFPLFISALEHYRETAEVLEGWWKIRSKYKECMRNLKFHQLVFEENLEELLLPLIADEDKLQRLLQNPGGQEWEDPKLEETLKGRMPKTYSVYLDTIKMMGKTVKDLDEALGINKTHFQNGIAGKTKKSIGLVEHMSASLGYHGQVIKIAFNKTVLNQLFEEFGTYNNRLRDILGTSDRLASLRRSRKVTTGKSILSRKLWQHGSNILNLLSEAWSCRCQSFHTVNLLLQHRITSSVNFRIVFWFKSHLSLPSQPPPWSWQETDIRLLEAPAAAPSITIHVPPVSTAIPPQRPALASSSMKVDTDTTLCIRNTHRSSRTSFMRKWRKPSGSQVSLTAASDSESATSTGLLPNSSSITTTTVSLSTSSIATSISSDSSSNTARVSFAAETISLSEQTSEPGIADLCAKIATCPPDLPKYGYLKSEERQYIVQPLCKASTQPREHVSLQEVLTRTPKLTRRKRLEIAHILASSFVQLHPTPWVHSSWSKKDIFFLSNANDRSKVFTDQPYVSRPASRPLQSNGRTSRPPLNSTFQESIHSLGIMLLELCFGKAIEDHELCVSINTKNERIMQAFLYGIASDWAQHVLEEAGPDYSDAVYWCLHQNSVGDAGDEGWREDMIARVVDPLKACHDQLIAL